MAALYQLFILAIAVCLTRICECQVAEISIQPEPLTLVPNISTSKTSTGVVTILCKANNVNDLRGISIFRKKPMSNSVLLVTADVGSNSGSATYPSGVNLPNSGIGGSIAEKQIFLNLTQAGCSDEANFTCSVTDFNNAYYTVDKAKALNVEVTPGPLYMTVITGNKEEPRLNETFEILCNTPIGKVDTSANNTVEIVWEYRYGVNLNTEWKSYLDSENDGKASDIQDGTIDEVPGSCFSIQSSTLIREISALDSNREYRCYVRRDGTSYTQYAGILVLGIIGSGVTTTSLPPTDDEPSKDNVGMIVGIVVGVLVLVVIIIVIIVFVVRRKNTGNKDTYEGDTADTNSKPTETAPPYTVDSHVSYSHPNRFREPRGVSNRGMDDTGDKPAPYESKPARYANDFHQGRPNQAYDDDSDGRRARRYNSDNDGTDFRLNSSSVSGDGDPNLGTAI